MGKQTDSSAFMKAGLIIAAVILAIRIGLEQLGASESITNIFGVVWLYIILPILFAREIVRKGKESRFRILLKNLFFFALYTRLMVMFTYMLAYYFGWQAPRFSIAMGGNVGDNIHPINGLLVIPARNAIIWIAFAVVIGMILGGMFFWLKRKSSPPTKET
jgi:hypothetical protein